MYQAAEADEPGSVVYTQRKWRRSRNEKILEESNTTKGMAGKRKKRERNKLLFKQNQTEPFGVTREQPLG